MSRYGTLIVGRALDARGAENAALWTNEGGWRLLGSFTPNAQPCDELLSGAFGANDDGTVVVGLGWNGCGDAHGFRWEASTSTDVSITSGGTAGTLFEMTKNGIQGNLVYQFRGAAATLTPFVFGGLGATLMDAPELDTETKLSWTVGGGVKWFLQRHVGVRAHLRYKPTQLNDGSSDFCNPFGFCQTLLTHFEVAAGATFRF